MNSVTTPDPGARLHGAQALRLGVLSTAFAFIAWGVLPIYWKTLRHVPPAEVLAYRVVWTFALALVLAAATRRLRETRAALCSPRTAATFITAACLLGANWYMFVFAVANRRIVDCSLGYYINPLVNVLLGFLVLRERFRPFQVLAIALAAAGVLFLTLRSGQVPWIPLTLAGTFGLYALVRKTARYEALPGLVIETSCLVLPAAMYLLALGGAPWTAREDADTSTALLLAGTGIITVLPLLTFAYGARRVRLATVGFIQFLTPTCMLLIGVLDGEPFTATLAVTFACIWTGLAVYTAEACLRTRKSSARADRPPGRA